MNHVHVVWLPPNCTALIQPLDQGIIRSFKAKYRHLLLRHILACLDNQKVALTTTSDCFYRVLCAAVFDDFSAVIVGLGYAQPMYERCSSVHIGCLGGSQRLNHSPLLEARWRSAT